MRKHKRLLYFATFLYIILAVGMASILRIQQKDQDNRYRVEINRICNEVQSGRDIDSLKLKNQYQYIMGISYLSAQITDSDAIMDFYRSDNGTHMEIVPIENNNSVSGYLRFDYQQGSSNNRLLFLSEAALALMYLIVIIIFLYTNEKILKPFHTLSEMPYELAKGNLNDEIKESKNRYFGKFVWGIAVLKDALEAHKKRELKLAKDKKMLLLSISHDIKTPLNAISLYAKAILEGIYETKEEQVEAAANIQKRAEEIDAFVKEIIKSSTEEVISIEVNDMEFYLEELVQKIKSGYMEKSRIQKTKFTIGTYENHLLKGDMDRLYEAVGNIMENALKYGDGKEIRISFSEEDYCELITIYNSGIPIEDNDINHLFDSFYRGSNAHGKQGNGLGLYICHEIMKKMNGDIFAKRLEDGMEFVLVCRMS